MLHLIPNASKLPFPDVKLSDMFDFDFAWDIRQYFLCIPEGYHIAGLLNSQEARFVASSDNIIRAWSIGDRHALIKVSQNVL